ncbi:MAG TPA: hypothetical protein VI916_09675 [Acidimicrobiia bacterium]|nr:hypothetical protein [Acidimicrobiia bacterium]
MFGGVSAILLVLVIVFALLWDGARGDQGDTDAVRRVAGTFTDRFLTLDSKDLEPNKRGVLALSTGAFKRTYEEGLETQVLQAILALGDTTTEATITEIYLGEVDERTAHVIVQAETTAYTIDESGAARPPLTQEIYIELDLLKQDGAWLVDHVAHLNFGGPRSSSDVPSEPAPSPTTAPA